ncbi:MAG: FG-GAP-like repeat-containing protein [Proteobacteria bacterium]|nr:FG-GAP-like repeat-containing protein [Pseudomonadota bacterium]
MYRNDAGEFINIGAPLIPVDDGSVAWGDYDNDGDLDILLTGSPGWESKVYRNDNGNFVDIGANLTGVDGSSVTWGDYDNDGDLDILLTGDTATGGVSKIYSNNIAISNTPPTSPTNLTSTVSENSAMLSWDKSTDNETPQNGLTYNLRVGTTPGGSEIVSPMADINIGYRKIPAIGNTNHNNSWTIKNLLPGTYYWSVQAIDNGFAGSEFAEEQSFSIALTIALLDPINNSLQPILLDNGQITTDVDKIAEAGASLLRSGVAADGVSKLILRINNVNAGDEISLTLVDDDGQDSDSLMSLDGSQSSNSSITVSAVSTSNGDKAFAVYRAPEVFHDSESELSTRNVSLQAKNITADQEVTIDLII